MNGPETKGVDSSTSSASAKETVDVAKTSSGATAASKEDDIKFLIDECEVSREAAEALLRANGNDLKRSIQAYIKSPLVIN